MTPAKMLQPPKGMHRYYFISMLPLQVDSDFFHKIYKTIVYMAKYLKDKDFMRANIRTSSKDNEEYMLIHH